MTPPLLNRRGFLARTVAGATALALPLPQKKRRNIFSALL
jgi:hypothetical protein